VKLGGGGVGRGEEREKTIVKRYLLLTHLTTYPIDYMRCLTSSKKKKIWEIANLIGPSQKIIK